FLDAVVRRGTEVICQHVSSKHTARKTTAENVVPATLRRRDQTNNTVLIKLNNVVAKDKALGRGTVSGDDIAGLLHRIMCNRDLPSAVCLQKVRNVVRLIRHNINQQIIDYANPLRFLALVLVVVAENIYSSAGVPHYVVPDLDVFDCAPGSFTTLIAHGKHKRRCQYLAFDQVAFNNYTLRILQFECAFDWRPSIPLAWFAQEVATELDIRGNKIRNRRIGTANKNHLARTFEIVINNVEWPGTIPAGYSLGLITCTGETRNVRINN